MVDIDVITTLIVGFVKVACTLLSMIGKKDLCPEYIGTRQYMAEASGINMHRMRWNGSSPDFFEETFNRFPSLQFNFSQFFADMDGFEGDISFSLFDSDEDEASEGSEESEGGEDFARTKNAALNLADSISGSKLKQLLEKAGSLLDNPVTWDKPIKIDYEKPEKFKSRGSIMNLKLLDASKYEVGKVNVDNSDIEIQLGMNDVKISGDYDASLHILDTDTFIEGKGPFHVDLKDVNTWLKITLSENEDKTIDLEDFKIQVKPDSIKANFNGISGGGKSEEELNEMIGKEMISKLETLHSDPQVEQALSKVSQKYWKLLFGGTTFKQISSLINSMTT